MIRPQQSSAAAAVAILGLALAAPFSLPGTAMAGEASSQVDRKKVKEALTECLDTHPERLPRLMSTLGNPAVASGFELLLDPPLRPTGKTWLSSDESNAIIEGLGAQPSALRRYLDSEVVPTGAQRERAIALETLVHVASDADFDLLIALASPVDPAVSSPLLNERLRATVLASLQGGRWTNDVVSDSWRRMTPGMRRAFSRALGETDQLAGVETLANLVTWKLKEDRRLVLDALTRIAGRHRVLGGRDIEASVLPLLKSEDAEIRRSAIRVAAALQLGGAVPELVRLMRDSDDDHASAIDALHAITDVQLPDDVGRWSLWLQKEKEWTVLRRPNLLATLGQSPAATHVALRELGDHRWGRRDTVVQLRPLLSHRDPNIRAATAACLGRLKCASATEDLLDLLDDVDQVAKAARSALEAVTGKRLPRGSNDWRGAAAAPIMLD